MTYDEKVVAKPYQTLIEQLLDQQISTDEFETGYLKLFKDETHPLTHELYEILNSLFLAVDALCTDPMLFDAACGDITQEQLRAEASVTYKKLKRYTFTHD